MRLPMIRNTTRQHSRRPNQSAAAASQSLSRPHDGTQDFVSSSACASRVAHLARRPSSRARRDDRPKISRSHEAVPAMHPPELRCGGKPQSIVLGTHPESHLVPCCAMQPHEARRYRPLASAAPDNRAALLPALADNERRVIDTCMEEEEVTGAGRGACSIQPAEGVGAGPTSSSVPWHDVPLAHTTLG